MSSLSEIKGLAVLLQRKLGPSQASCLLSMNQETLSRKFSRDRDLEVQVACQLQSQTMETLSRAILCLTKETGLMIQ